MSFDNESAPEPLDVTDSPSPRDIQLLEDSIDEFNMSSTGIRDARLLAIMHHDRDARLVAGLYGWTWGGCCEIKTFWIDEQWRGRGLGTHLIQAAETEARDRGATQIVLSTHSFQAPRFYQRFGFEIVGQVNDYPAGYQSIYMRKHLR